MKSTCFAFDFESLFCTLKFLFSVKAIYSAIKHIIFFRQSTLPGLVEYWECLGIPNPIQVHGDPFFLARSHLYKYLFQSGGGSILQFINV